MSYAERIPDCRQRALYRYWLGKRRHGRVPAVRAIDPRELPPKDLPWLFLFRREGVRRFRCVLVGTGIVRLDGYDSTGRYIDDMSWTVNKPRQILLFEEAARTGLPLWYAGRRAVSEDSTRAFSRLLLPASADGYSIDHICGMLSVATPEPVARYLYAADPAQAPLRVERAKSADLFPPARGERALEAHG